MNPDSRALWALVAIVSPAVEIVWHFAFGAIPDWLLWLRMSALAAVAIAGGFRERAKPLRAFCCAYLFQLVVVAILRAVRGSSPYRSFVAQHGFVGSVLFLQLVWIALLCPAVVWVFRLSDRFYSRTGYLAARVGLSGVGVHAAPLRWNVLGPVLAVVSTLCAWLFVRATGAPVRGTGAMVPWAVLFAAVNAFGEEGVNRNLLIGAVRTEFGAAHAVVVSASVFGFEHWNGLPGGAVGVLMTAALALVAGRAMIDTKGTFWPWFMHALPDVVLFYYWGVGSVGHG